MVLPSVSAPVPVPVVNCWTPSTYFSDISLSLFGGPAAKRGGQAELSDAAVTSDAERSASRAVVNAIIGIGRDSNVAGAAAVAQTPKRKKRLLHQAGNRQHAQLVR